MRSTDEFSIDSKSVIHQGLADTGKTAAVVWNLHLPDQLLDPPDGHYPFIEWDDLTSHQRGLYLGGRIASMMRLRSISLDPQRLTGLADLINAISVKNDTREESLKAAFYFLDEAKRMTEEAKAARATQDYDPRHMQATVSQIGRYEAQPEAFPKRRESFHVPVKKYTALYGSSVASPGDMITGMTVEDTTPETSTINGVPETRYVAMAASL